jgi:hypothetical protein
MKINLRFVIGLLTALLTGIFIGSAITDQNLLFEMTLSDGSILMSIFTVAIGGFIGAYSAFFLKSYEENIKVKNNEVAALNSAIFVLIRQRNTILILKKHLDKYKTDFERGFNLPAMAPPDYSGVRQNIEKLEFLFKNNPQILFNLSIEQERFDQAMAAVNIRNNFYVDEIQITINKLRMNGELETLIGLESKLGERLYKGAIFQAQYMYEHVDKAEVTLEQTCNKLCEVAKDMYPKEKIIKWVGSGV